jgi:hypothetical protein
MRACLALVGDRGDGREKIVRGLYRAGENLARSLRET